MPGQNPSLRDDLQIFGKYGDAEFYGGRYMTAERLSSLSKAIHASRRDLIDRCLQSAQAAGCAASFDDTFKLAKRIRCVGVECTPA